ncbi:hypothetical protein AXF42_Ash006621 [Apostasia shenzhenica]|uniref:PHD-type zinc finger plants domain-containing protein n=1 Tax=Apostasia shenzhenica TaxID=1088818 RepID=A0A2I0AIP4_9ASPA|nr:hypothetical protein AXF42_Ash006621 [Apostasia shenzhenica]
MGGEGRSPAIVCCMCGDRGMPEELFRCKACLFRSQHKYCSDLYPKAEAYKACNWCLREGMGRSMACETAATMMITASDSSCSPSSGMGGGGRFGAKVQRVAPATLRMNKPVKKQRVISERASQSSAEKLRREKLSPAPPGKIRQKFRGKVRRYKLLEEVSS